MREWTLVFRGPPHEDGMIYTRADNYDLDGVDEIVHVREVTPALNPSGAEFPEALPAPPFPECEYLAWFKNELMIHGALSWQLAARWAWEKAHEKKQVEVKESE